MLTTLSLIEVVFYLLSTAGYLAVVLGNVKAMSKPALGLLIVGLVIHILTLGLTIHAEGVESIATIQRGLGVLAMLLGLGFVGVVAIYRITSLGAVVVPLMLFFAAVSVLAEPWASVPEGVQGPILTVHVATALFGTAAFVLAAVAAVLYLIQERNLKKKRFGPLFTRLPSVEVLDRVSLRFVTIGFPIYTLAIGLGGFFAWNTEGGFHAQYPFAVISWLIYAGIINARLTTGWRGRRAALATLGGLVGLTLVLTIYLVRG